MGNKGRSIVSWGNLREKYSASLTTSASTVAEITVNNVDKVSLEIVVASNPLATFVVKGRFHSAGQFNTLYSTTADYTNLTGLLVGTSGDLTALSGTGWLIMDVGALEVVQIVCSSSSTSTIDILAGG